MSRTSNYYDVLSNTNQDQNPTESDWSFPGSALKIDQNPKRTTPIKSKSSTKYDKHRKCNCAYCKAQDNEWHRQLFYEVKQEQLDYWEEKNEWW